MNNNETSHEKCIVYLESDTESIYGFTVYCQNMGLCVNHISDVNEFKTLITSKIFQVAIINISLLENPIQYLRKLKHELAITTPIIVISNENNHKLINEILSKPQEYADASLGAKDEYKVSELFNLCQDFISKADESFMKVIINYKKDIDDTITNFSKFWRNISRNKLVLSNTRIKKELDTVIKSFFLGAVDKEPISSVIDVDTLRGSGKSSAYLFKLAPRINLNTSLRKYAVLKFGPREEVELESHNYDKYVEWFLTYQRTVKKIAYEKTENFAGILYSFPLDEDSGIISFAEYIRTSKFELSCKIINEMFSTNNRFWLAIDGDLFNHNLPKDLQTYYINHSIRSNQENIIKDYKKIVDELNAISIKKRNTRLLVEKENTDEITIKPISLTIPNPIKYMMLPYVTQIDLSLVHGDLHANNILIKTDANNSAINYFFIDFYYTGFGHIFKDFIDLELSVRYDILCSRHIKNERDRFTRLDSKDVSDDGLIKLKTLEQDIIKYHTAGMELNKESKTYKDHRLLKVYKLITAIRNKAFENFPDRKYQYYTGLAYSSIKAIKYFFPLDVKLYRLIISGLYFKFVGRPSDAKKIK